jgi:hypothetical protein
VYHQDALRHQESGDQSKAVQAERLGLRDAQWACQDAPAEGSGFRVRHQDAPAECSEFRDDHWACQDAPAEGSGSLVRHQDAPAEYSEFRDDHQVCQDVPACRRGVQVDCRPGDPVSRVPVACPLGDAAASKWEAGDAMLAE